MKNKYKKNRSNYSLMNEIKELKEKVQYYKEKNKKLRKQLKDARK